MEKRRLGRTGLMVTPLGFGGAELGFGEHDDTNVANTLNAALDAGINVIDTAECYRDGEEKIGRTVSHRRDEFFLFSKCGHNPGFELPDWDPQMLAQSIDRSLVRLRTDHVDLMQFHSCGIETLQNHDVLEVLTKAKRDGKTRFIGYSGDREDAKFAIELGIFETLQTSVNVADQQAIELTLPLAKAADMGVIAKRPVANVAWRRSPDENAYERRYWERLQELDYPFLHTTDDVETALRFTLSQDVHVAIVGASRPQRIAENLRFVSNGRLPDEAVRAIRGRWAQVAKADWVGQG